MLIENICFNKMKMVRSQQRRQLVVSQLLVVCQLIMNYICISGKQTHI